MSSPDGTVDDNTSGTSGDGFGQGVTRLGGRTFFFFFFLFLFFCSFFFAQCRAPGLWLLFALLTGPIMMFEYHLLCVKWFHLT